MSLAWFDISALLEGQGWKLCDFERPRRFCDVERSLKDKERDDDFEDARSVDSADSQDCRNVHNFVDCEENSGDTMDLQKLRARFPSVHLEELTRFYRGAKQNMDLATKRLKWMLQWRAENPPEAISAAAAKLKSTGFLTVAGHSLSGNPIVFVQCARYQPKVASAHEYVLAMVAALDALCPAGSDGQVVVLDDLRPGKGWPNCPALEAVPMIRALVPVFAGLYPERLAKAIIYPLPWWAKAAWSIIRSCLDPATAEKMVIVSGRDGCFDDLDDDAAKALRRHVSYEGLPQTVQYRHASMQHLA
eukprot:TRINITY_DN26005_c0_g1_i1.p1 TRINITY_DN26005_c0_g1~~TRINITY_DN26005_c0_g1_i1.p1  ORF type:complete len:304 (+),score=63.90 TRINITY_DN26005_c0_g1_i1:73-984(+)